MGWFRAFGGCRSLSKTLAVTQLLTDWQAGKEKALDALTPYLYDELRRLAQSYMAGERSSHTLQATALVHEAYVRLVGTDAAWQDRVHFFAIAAQVMRRILVDHARAKARTKRGGGIDALPLHESLVLSPETEPEIVALDEALDRLTQKDEQMAKIVELLFFGGLTYEEAAAALDISRSTLIRKLNFAKAWLRDALADE